MQQQNQQPPPYIILSAAIFLLLLIITVTLTPTPPTPPPIPPHPSLFPPHHPYPYPNPTHPPTPPSLAYLISGSISQSKSIIRLLLSIYHPKNHYMLHLYMSDSNQTQTARDEFVMELEENVLFRSAQNVYVVGKADYVYENGPSRLASEIHGASLLLRVAEKWDWFVSLDADDYPLVSQDDLLHVLSYLPRNLNFVNHTGYIGWRESRKLKPIVVDPSLFLADNSQMFYATQKRPLPDAYRLFTGSSTAILTREFIEFCILGTDNLPRTLLMYLSNAPVSTPVYFPTILCNSRQFNRTTINHSLQFTRLDSRQKPLTLNSSYFAELKNSGTAFASSFSPNDPVLDRIDQELLQRSPGKPVPGGWCLGESSKDQCGVWGDANVLRPGHGVKRLEKLFVELLSTENNQFRQCVVE